MLLSVDRRGTAASAGAEGDCDRGVAVAETVLSIKAIREGGLAVDALVEDRENSERELVLRRTMMLFTLRFVASCRVVVGVASNSKQ